MGDEDGEDGEEEHGETLCGACGDNYASDEFWICCDIYETAKWEKITYAGIVTCTILSIYNLSKGHPHHEDPPAYPYLHIRNKEFPWGDMAFDYLKCYIQLIAIVVSLESTGDSGIQWVAMVRRSVRLQVTESQSAMDKATARKAALVADQYGISTGVGGPFYCRMPSLIPRDLD
ncbi:uncharacterized protein A4U43_C03F24030 [Asparagus officinalis]|uniref:Uncharacterized protein n=1 Tax=Asparagus officinalis TaxID=4686 RepID=A0A5P1FDC9_ASPOF|nr:uncharacterized protein A4U43_C03F24030 [Asparagus officinalis]